MTKKNEPEFVSMGCRVETPECSLCGPIIDNGIAPAMRFEKRTGSVEFISFGLVPAPTCELCSTSMVFTKVSTQWACPNAKCSNHGVHIETGIGGVLYPR